VAVFQGLAQHLEDVASELGSSSRNKTPWWDRLTSPGRGMVPRGQRRIADAVVRRAEGARGDETRLRAQQAGDAVDARDVERLVQVQVGQDARQAPREHGLARSRWSNEKDVVTAAAPPPGRV